MPIRNYKEPSSFQIEKDSSASHTFQEPLSPKLVKSPSIQMVAGGHVLQPQDTNFNSLESPKTQSPPSEQMIENGKCFDASEKAPSMKRQDSFESRLPELPKIDVHSVHRQTSSASDPESPISPLLTSDPKNERSHSKTFSRPLSQLDEMPMRHRNSKGLRHQNPPSFWRLTELSFTEWLYALLGSIGAATFGSFNPLLAYVLALTVEAYYSSSGHHLRREVDKWCLIIACMGIVTVVANFLQHFYFGIMGEKMTERVRRMMFSGKISVFVLLICIFIHIKANIALRHKMFNCSICLTLTAEAGFQWNCFKIGQEIEPVKWMVCLKLVWQFALIQLGPNMPLKLCKNFKYYKLLQVSVILYNNSAHLDVLGLNGLPIPMSLDGFEHVDGLGLTVPLILSVTG